MIGVELVSHLVADEIDVIGVALGFVEPRDRHGLDAGPADGAQHADTAAAGGDDMPQVVIFIADFPVDDLLALFEEAVRVAVGERRRQGIEEDQLVVAVNEIEFDGQLPPVDLVDPADRRDHGRQGLVLVGAGAAALITGVLRRAAQGQTVGTDAVALGGPCLHRRSPGGGGAFRVDQGGIISKSLIGAIVALVIAGVGFSRDVGIDIPGPLTGQHLGVEAQGCPIEGNGGCRVVGHIAREGPDLGIAGGQFGRHHRSFLKDHRDEPPVRSGQRERHALLERPRCAAGAPGPVECRRQ
ncbi:MAG: hypothetical protein BWX88_05384 [Planctomycetes bacterium ADurb.Bin126]|nr:MAG: hypothetical protein BWX88_05384 [Planctomycetes bacterium ADurb.Bin126]